MVNLLFTIFSDETNVSLLRCMLSYIDNNESWRGYDVEDPLVFRDEEGFTYIDVHDKGSLKLPNPSPYYKHAASVVYKAI